MKHLIQMLQKNTEIERYIQSNAQRCVLAVSFSDGFITAIVVNPPERKMTKRTSLQ